MKKHRSKIICCVFALLIFTIALGPAAAAKAVPDYSREFYVNDFANVLSEETESEIQTHAISLANETTAQVCVLTIDSLEGEDISEYSVKVFRDWGIGNEQENNGVLILLSVDDREMWVTTGYGVEGTLTDITLGQMRDTFAVPYYSQDDFDTGTRLLFGAIVNELRTEEYGLEPDGDLVLFQNDNMYQDDVGTLDSNGIFIFLAVWSLLIIMPGISWIYTTIRYLKLKRYDKMHGTNRAAEYKKQLEEKKKRYNSTNHRGGHYHGGGFGGGGFSGGGGGGFHGGGGSTGGGGAGGRF